MSAPTPSWSPTWHRTGRADRGADPGELQVLQLVADGLPNKAIAARLVVSDETVKFHLAAVFGSWSVQPD